MITVIPKNQVSKVSMRKTTYGDDILSIEHTGKGYVDTYEIGVGGMVTRRIIELLSRTLNKGG